MFQSWISDEPNKVLNPEDWGLELTSQGTYGPRFTDLPPALDPLLKVTKCNCKTDCSSKRCNCRRHGLECSIACGHCQGISCTNTPTLVEVEEEFVLQQL